MIIVSQSKLSILNFNNLLGLGVKSSIDNKSIEIKAYEFGIKDIEGITLGRYETLERAKEVLEEIVESYLGVNIIEEQDRQLNFDENTQIRIRPNHYRMPKE